MSAIAVGGFGLFSDEVFSSTDLNRRSAEVLNHASKNPVTISRNNEWFALLRRDQAAALVKGLAQTVMVVQMAQGAVAIRRGCLEQVPPSVAWMKVFDDEERLTMLSEIFASCVQASGEGDWDNVSSIIHQWHESAMLLDSGLLREAMASEAEEEPLPDPRSFIDEAEKECEPAA
jgi:hypothetical protein